MRIFSTYTYLLTFGLCIMTGCTGMDEEVVPDDRVSDAPIEFFANIDESTQTRTYGSTGYQATTFGIADQIGVFATRARKDGGVVTTNDIFHGFANVGYKSGDKTDALNSRWTPLVTGAPIKAPLFPSTMLDIYAYYPHAGSAELNAKTNIIINTSDLHNITFRIHQSQTTTNLNLCNIMRATPILNESYTVSKKVTLTFEHIMTFLEFHIYLDNTDIVGEKWIVGDVVLLDRVVVLGNKVSTEGSFDLVDPAGPNVRITSNSTTANGSIYKADATSTPVVDGAEGIDAVTGATQGGSRFLKRNVIIPPIPMIPANAPDPNPSLGEQGDMEVMLELKYLPPKAAPEDPDPKPIAVNRHFIVKGHAFESGKKYIIKVPVKRKATTNQKLTIIEESITGWTSLNPTYNFD